MVDCALQRRRHRSPLSAGHRPTTIDRRLVAKTGHTRRRRLALSVGRQCRLMSAVVSDVVRPHEPTLDNTTRQNVGRRGDTSNESND